MEEEAEAMLSNFKSKEEWFLGLLLHWLQE